MCYADDAQPPAPPRIGALGDHGDLVLESADGTRFGAYAALPEPLGERGVVVLPDVRGLHAFYKDLARNFAEAGLAAIALDYFGRTAGVGERDESFPFREHVEKLEPQRVDEDVAAAVRWLRGNGAAHVFTVGFCMGGAMSWRQSATQARLSGCMGFYGVPSRVADLVPTMRTPLLLLAAGQDFTPVAEVEALAERVRSAGVDAELHVYPDAPHSFFDRTFGEHAEACADAWRRMLDFVERHAPAG
jgi:carboxymethylenebutenolidase